MVYEFFFETVQIKNTKSVSLELRPGPEELLEWERNGRKGNLEHTLNATISYGAFKPEIVDSYFSEVKDIGYVTLEFDYDVKTSKSSLLFEEDQLPLVEELCRIFGFLNKKHHLRKIDESEIGDL